MGWDGMGRLQRHVTEMEEAVGCFFLRTLPGLCSCKDRRELWRARLGSELVRDVCVWGFLGERMMGGCSSLARYGQLVLGVWEGVCGR